MTPKQIQRRLDCDRFSRLQDGLARIRARFGDPAIYTKNKTHQKLWLECEQIKNRYGGMPPQPAEPEK